MGGGRQPCPEVIPALEAAFLQVLQDHTAGSPMQATVTWTNLTQPAMVERWATEPGIPSSVTVVKRWLRQQDFVRRQAQKRQRTGECMHRAAQGTKIARLKEE